MIQSKAWTYRICAIAAVACFFAAGLNVLFITNPINLVAMIAALASGTFAMFAQAKGWFVEGCVYVTNRQSKQLGLFDK